MPSDMRRRVQPTLAQIMSLRTDCEEFDPHASRIVGSAPRNRMQQPRKHAMGLRLRSPAYALRDCIAAIIFEHRASRCPFADGRATEDTR